MRRLFLWTFIPLYFYSLFVCLFGSFLQLYFMGIINAFFGLFCWINSLYILFFNAVRRGIRFLSSCFLISGVLFVGEVDAALSILSFILSSADTNFNLYPNCFTSCFFVGEMYVCSLEPIRKKSLFLIFILIVLYNPLSSSGSGSGSGLFKGNIF